jgi:hypothetical protein
VGHCIHFNLLQYLERGRSTAAVERITYLQATDENEMIQDRILA